MIDTMLPIIRQMHDADGDRPRADILLRCPDAVLLKYAEVFRAACRRFPPGAAFVDLRVALMLAVRNGAGGLPGRLAMEAEQLRAELAAYAAGAQLVPPAGDARPLWPLDAPQDSASPDVGDC